MPESRHWLNGAVWATFDYVQLNSSHALLPTFVWFCWPFWFWSKRKRETIKPCMKRPLCVLCNV